MPSTQNPAIALYLAKNKYKIPYNGLFYSTKFDSHYVSDLIYYSSHLSFYWPCFTCFCSNKDRPLSKLLHLCFLCLECSFYRYLHVTYRTLFRYRLQLSSCLTMGIKMAINPHFTQHTIYLSCFIFFHRHYQHMKDHIFISLLVYCLPLHDQNINYMRGRISGHFLSDSKTVLETE